MNMDIRNNIAELLSLHDCVIIPGFGGFIGNYSPARIDPVHHTFHPPSKTLLFNINLKQNDGLLTHAVASSYGATYAEASRMVEEFSYECRTTLKQGKPYHLSQIGHLSPGKEGVILFEQDPGYNLNPDAFGLAPFMSPPVIRDKNSVFHDHVVPGGGAKTTGRKLVLPRALKWAAVIALPIGIATVIGVTRYDRLSADFASNAGILSSVFTRFSSTSLVEKKSAPARPLQPIVIPKAEPPAAPVEPVISPDDRFAVIVGAFRIQENAEKLVALLQQKGFSASVFDQSKTGLFRVTIGTSANREEARQLLASAKSTEFSGAWLLAK